MGTSITEIKELISKNNIKKALEKLEELVSLKKPNKKNDVTLLKNKYANLRQNQIKGIAKEEALNFFLNNLLEFIDLLPNDHYSAQKIEFVSVVVDKEKCSWYADEANDNVFRLDYDKDLNPHIVLNWSFINHSENTIILKGIRHSTTGLFSGISGVPQPSILKSLIQYEIPLEFDKGEQRFNIVNQIQVPAKQAFQFQILPFYYSRGNQKYPLKSRLFIDFHFDFSGNQTVKAPRLFFNCESEDEEVKLLKLG